LIEDAFDILLDVCIPDADDSESIGRKCCIPLCVFECVTLDSMLTSIKLDDEPWMIAGEIDDEVLDRRLPPEMKA
jgi:hypothetical protein